MQKLFTKKKKKKRIGKKGQVSEILKNNGYLDARLKRERERDK